MAGSALPQRNLPGALWAGRGAQPRVAGTAQPRWQGWALSPGWVLTPILHHAQHRGEGEHPPALQLWGPSLLPPMPWRGDIPIVPHPMGSGGRPHWPMAQGSEGMSLLSHGSMGMSLLPHHDLGGVSPVPCLPRLGGDIPTAPCPTACAGCRRCPSAPPWPQMIQFPCQLRAKRCCRVAHRGGCVPPSTPLSLPAG